MASVWFFLVFSLGAHNGHSFTQRTVIDRIVLPTREACEAARRGFEEYEAGERGILYEPGPCQPVPSKKTDELEGTATPGSGADQALSGRVRRAGRGATGFLQHLAKR